MKIAICEDELLFQQKLKSGIERFFAEKKTETKFDCFVNGAELINNLTNEYDIMLLGDDFVEVHKAVFVNISKIKRINTDTVTMCDKSNVPLSRRNRGNVICAVMKRIGKK